MSRTDYWRLPEGVDELLPPQAERLEHQRRRLLDLYRGWGYELVVPPFIEFLESLQVGHDLDLKTFKVTDQRTGRMMGVRADMTPQVARIDAHRLKRDVPTRLCYLGTVLYTTARDLSGSRSPLQVGAELYGHDGVQSDAEILGLLIETLETVGVRDISIDLGHVGVFRGLARQAGLTPDQESELFDQLQRKARAEIEAFIAALEVDDAIAAMLNALVDLHGDDEVLVQAREALAAAEPDVLAALDNVAAIAAAIRHQRPDLTLHFDLAELRGYGYHTGIVFAAFTPGHGGEIAAGGRYDDIGRIYGRARPATGFSADLRKLLRSVDAGEADPPTGIFAPADDDATLCATINALRDQGEQVIRALPGQAGGAREMSCNRTLVQGPDGWFVQPVE